jgi:hypothetical protein
MILERHASDGLRVTLSIAERELMSMKLLPGDQLLLNDCDREDASIADRLLALELIARRIEEES